jgi:hypothetical protein
MTLKVFDCVAVKREQGSAEFEEERLSSTFADDDSEDDGWAPMGGEEPIESGRGIRRLVTKLPKGMSYNEVVSRLKGLMSDLFICVEDGDVVFERIHKGPNKRYEWFRETLAMAPEIIVYHGEL